jgi:hypothetical protein
MTLFARGSGKGRAIDATSAQATDGSHVRLVMADRISRLIGSYRDCWISADNSG